MPKPKKPTVRHSPTTTKTPRVAEEPDFYKQFPSWQVTMLQVVDPYGWHQLDEARLHQIRERLISFESMTWGQILVQGRKRHHRIETNRISKPAQKCLEQLKIKEDSLVSLGLTGKGRIWGILDRAVLRLLWWDPDHLVCPARKRNT